MNKILLPLMFLLISCSQETVFNHNQWNLICTKSVKVKKSECQASIWNNLNPLPSAYAGANMAAAMSLSANRRRDEERIAEMCSSDETSYEDQCQEYIVKRK